MKPTIIILSGISASGKTTIQRELTNHNYHKVITSTTRKPREKDCEVHGKDYYFYSEKDFLNGVKKGDFAETEKHGDNHYGTQWSALDNEKTIPCAILEPKGAKKLKDILIKNGWAAYSVWVDCPFDVAVSRIKSRDDENKDALNKRLKLMNTIEKDWKDSMKYDLTVNSLDDISKIIKKIKSINKNQLKLK
jgi:guanylate kinase